MFVGRSRGDQSIAGLWCDGKNGVQHEDGAFDDGNLHSFQSTGAYERAFSLS